MDIHKRRFDQILSPLYCRRTKLNRSFALLALHIPSPGDPTNKNTLHFSRVFLLAGPTGFEPAISSVTGRRVRPATPRALVSCLFSLKTIRFYQNLYLFAICYNILVIATLAQLVERHIRNV